VTLQSDLDRVAEAVVPLADEDEELAGILAAEPTGDTRIYLCAFRAGEAVTWLALDDAGETVTSRERLRAAASLVALCEIAEESAGGGELDELLSQLVALRLTENPAGIDDAEEAVLTLQRTIGGLPRLATLTYLDDVGIAAKRLEDALGGQGTSPFAEAMKASAGAVQSFIADVEAHYKAQLD